MRERQQPLDQTEQIRQLEERFVSNARLGPQMDVAAYFTDLILLDNLGVLAKNPKYLRAVYESGTDPMIWRAVYEGVGTNAEVIVDPMASEDVKSGAKMDLALYFRVTELTTMDQAPKYSNRKLNETLVPIWKDTWNELNEWKKLLEEPEDKGRDLHVKLGIDNLVKLSPRLYLDLNAPQQREVAAALQSLTTDDALGFFDLDNPINSLFVDPSAIDSKSGVGFTSEESQVIIRRAQQKLTVEQVNQYFDLDPLSILRLYGPSLGFGYMEPNPDSGVPKDVRTTIEYRINTLDKDRILQLLDEDPLQALSFKYTILHHEGPLHIPDNQLRLAIRDRIRNLTPEQISTYLTTHPEAVLDMDYHLMLGGQFILTPQAQNAIRDVLSKIKFSHEPSTTEQEQGGLVEMGGASIAKKRVDNAVENERINEDSFFTDPETLSAGVFDGVGGTGNEASINASQKAKEAALKLIRETPYDPVLMTTKILPGVESAINYGETTAAIVRLNPSPIEGEYDMIGVRVGDSRIYHFNSDTGTLEQLMDDQNGAAASGWIDKNDRPKQGIRIEGIDGYLDRRRTPTDILPNSNLGSTRFSSPNYWATKTVKAGDYVLLTSDGIHDNVDRVEFEKLVKAGILAGDTPEQMSIRIAKASKEAAKSGRRESKGDDDMTVTVLAIYV